MDWPRFSRFLIISRVAILKEILTDPGTLLMSNTLKELHELLGIKSAQTTVYHPRTDGLMERLNKSLKSMIHNFIHEDERNWTNNTICCLQCGRCPRPPLEFSPFVFCRCVLPYARPYHSHRAPGMETHQSLIVCSWPYTLPEHKRLIIQKELPKMLKMGVLGESHISWCSP